MLHPPIEKFWFLHAMVLSALLTAKTIHAEPELTVRGTAHVSVNGLESGQPGIQGSVRDDSGSPVPGSQVQIELFSARGGQRLLLPRARDCNSGAQLAPPGEEKLQFATSSSGQFCIAFGSRPAGSSLRISSLETRLLAQRTIWLDLTPAGSLGLRVEGLPKKLNVDVAHRFRVVLSNQPALEPLDIHLALQGQPEPLVVVRQAQSEVDLEIPSRSLGAPGPATLVVSAKQGVKVAARSAILVVRSTVVRLSLRAQEADGGTAIFHVDGKSPSNTVSTGVVEALVGGESAGSAPMIGGRAAVVVQLAPSERPIPLTLRYVPGAPWWEPGPNLHTTVLISEPPLSRTPWVIAAFVVSFLVLYGWWRPGRPRAPKRAPSRPAGRPGVVHHRSSAMTRGWRGTVVDAHTSSPVRGATISIGERVVMTDKNGIFPVLNGPEEGAKLEVSASGYQKLSEPAPQWGKLTLAIATKRRAALDRLAHWASRKAWPSRGDPTPGQVHGQAVDRNRPDVASWALDTEHAAYGPNPVDDQQEQRLNQEPE